LHAHSWVEAYLPPNSPEAMQRLTMPELRKWAAENGAWLRLDPTTSNELVLAADTDSSWREVREVVDYVKFLWNNYVVSMDSEQQQTTIYEPVSRFTREWSKKLTSAATWRGWWEGIARNLQPNRWFSAKTGSRARRGISVLVVVGMLITAVVVVRRVRQRRRRAAAGDGRASRRTAPPVDFYVRLEHILAGRQLKRTPEQTQREFVQSACGELAESAATRGISNLPRRIVEAFYRVRFGGKPLDDVEQHEIETALAALTSALAPPAKP
jgi:hypothetical protein